MPLYAHTQLQSKLPTAIAPPSAAALGAQGPGGLSAMNGGLVAVGQSSSSGSSAPGSSSVGGSSSGSTAGVPAAGGPMGTGIAASGVDRYGLLALLGVIRMSDPDLTTLAIGSDLTTLGLNLNSQECVARIRGETKVGKRD